MRSILIQLLIASALLLGMASPALAQHQHPHEVDADFEDFLNTIDALPTPELFAKWPDAEQRLLNVARDTEESVYRRWRATSMLSNFETPAVRTALLTLTTDAAEDLRGMALLVLGARFLKGGDAEVLAAIEARLSDADASVRRDAVRALAYGHGPQIEARLSAIALGDDPGMARIASRALNEKATDTQ
ncbi:hypothetical protein DL240_10275 [Lujinxingia litoralis]|uniref:HEAT repeat domain-containing protein n=1 Tax=Lujinxingia litoralis TaxID=2211119 RepID=A0A328C760_9DELT|nr:HEAT repeat domain-containing protein [Lujinxingia litoralis]RAL22230.1 hypothetical protein DL240_10275 [Lujinxingia litoralis]